jgi:uncharacterized protein (DUF1684 family)
VYRDVELAKKEEFKDYLFFLSLYVWKRKLYRGRYIDLKIPKGNTIVVDFNTTQSIVRIIKYSCPLVPLENDLDVAITAGVKTFH